MRISESLQALSAFGASDLGRVRALNEDTFICDPERGVFAVIDGVGGQAGGEVAAAIARRELDLRLRRETGTVEDRVREAIAAANASILAEAERVPALRQMACVLTVAVVASDQVVAGHVGDTRLYKLGPSGMQKLTHDHSPVGQLEDRGHLSEDEAMRHPDRNQVFREVGTHPRQPTDPEFIEVVTAPFAAGDAILLCSDGVSDQVPSGEIERIVREAADAAGAVAGLLAAANDAGGRDNATAILAAGPYFGAPPAARRHTGDTAELVRVGGTGDQPAANPIHGTRGTGTSSDEPHDARAPRRRRRGRILLAATALAVLTIAILWPTGTLSPAATPGGSAPAPSRVLLVSSTAGAGAGFSSIASALAAAQPGDIIDVAPGMYREAVVMKEGVSIRARLPRAAVLQPPDALGGPWTAISASSIRSGGISGFVVDGAGARLEYGVWVNDANVELDDLDIAGARAAAVHVSGRSAVRLRSSLIHDNAGAGVVVDAGATPQVLHNVITGNGRVPPARPGIELRPGAQATIVGNILKGNGQSITGASAADIARFGAHNALEAPPRAAR